jgi:hypothetical protein
MAVRYYLGFPDFRRLLAAQTGSHRHTDEESNEEETMVEKVVG